MFLFYGLYSIYCDKKLYDKELEKERVIKR